MAEDDDDNITLPADTLNALQAFYNEKDSRAQQFEDLKSKAEEEFDDTKEWNIDAFAEDWNASQFWYTDETASTIARALLEGATHDSWIAIVSAPSVFIQLKKLLAPKPPSLRPHLQLLEYDSRFSVFGPEFTLYDFAHPLRLPAEFKARFDRIVCDPPFLSEDCQTKAAVTVRWLARHWATPQGKEDRDGREEEHGEAEAEEKTEGEKQQQQRVIVCTGERMEELVLRLYGKVGVKTTAFLPEHAKGLSNEFRCYANCRVGN